MVERSKLIRFRSGGYANRVFRLVGTAVVAFALFTVLSLGVSQACPKAAKASPDENTATAVVHPPAAKMVHVASAPTSSPAVPVKGVDCCGLGHGHCAGMDGPDGCCSACAPALLAFSPTLIIEQVSDALIFSQLAGFARSKPPPEFRPPRIFV